MGKKSVRTDIGFSLLYLFPSFMLLMIFSIIPIVMNIILSFTSDNVMQPPKFVGLENYIRMLRDPYIVASFKNTILFTVIIVPLQTIISLLFAAFIASYCKKTYGSVIRTVLFIPVIASTVLVGTLWLLLLSSYGPVNELLQFCGLPAVNWFGGKTSSIISVSSVSIWKNIGYFLVIFYAGILDIPASLYDAAYVDGAETNLFGWHTAASDPEYIRFLSAFIPQLLHTLHAEGFDKAHLIFHVSDEPNESTMSGYRAVKEILAPLLDGYTIMDALSSYEFYEKGLVAHPIPANDSIQPLIDHKVENLWVYYCVSQGIDVPNRFFAMPSARNRIIGVLMYLYNIRGFLHWGFNFYNTQFSKKHINPFIITDCGSAFSSGDAFLVYPAPDGGVYSSIRNEVQMEALADLRALKKLESLIGREKVCAMIQNGIGYPITFKKYPLEKEYLLALRYAVNASIKDHCAVLPHSHH